MQSLFKENSLLVPYNVKHNSYNVTPAISSYVPRKMIAYPVRVYVNIHNNIIIIAKIWKSNEMFIHLVNGQERIWCICRILLSSKEKKELTVYLNI